MSTETQRADNLKADIVEYVRVIEAQAAELTALKADMAVYVLVCSEQATEIEALRKDAERHNRIAELVLRAVEERRDREWDFMHLSLGEAAEIAATIQRERAAMQTKEAS